jgi:hypothetical protein
MLSDRERELLKELRGPSQQLQADSKRYMVDSKYRADVDAKDKAEGTSMGKWLRATYYGERVAAAPAPVAPPTETELAKAITDFPKTRCKGLYNRPANEPGELLSDLSETERQQAKIAAKFFNVITQGNGEPSVRFNYETRRDRDVKRAAKEAEAKKKESGLTDSGLPPGIERNRDGIGYLLVDEVAYQKWKDGNAAKAVIAKALEEVEA